MRRRWIGAIGGVALAVAMATTAAAHAVPVRQQPGAGVVLAEAPNQVVIEFDRALVAARSRVRVEDERGQQVDAGDARVASSHPNRLVVSLPPLSPGAYHVFWEAVGNDGHRTEGDYRFELR